MPSPGTPVDLAKLRSLSVIGRRGDAQVREWRSDNGERHKATTDETGTVTQHAHGDRQDALVRPETVHVTWPGTQ